MGHTKGTTQVVNRDVNAATRAAMALDLRAQKLSYDEIAKRCGYADRSACRKAVMRELERSVVGNVEELRREEAAMLDKLHEEVWPLVLDKANKNRLFAVDRVLHISERRSKLLGLDQGNNVVAAAQVIVRQYDADVESV